MATATAMRRSTLIKRLQSLKTIDECCVLASDLYPTVEKHDGTPAECFIAGWVNAMDMRDDGTLKEFASKNGYELDDAFVRIALHEVKNLGYLK